MKISIGCADWLSPILEMPEFLEKFFPQARHLEVQIFGDGEGRALSLGVRDCSAQRRNQKVLEETPPIGVNSKTLEALEESKEISQKASATYPPGLLNFFMMEMVIPSFFLRSIHACRLNTESPN